MSRRSWARCANCHKATYICARRGCKPAAEKVDAKALAEKLADAYSTDRYAGGWVASVKMLQRRGYDARQIEAIIRSKWTRWAGDASDNKYGRVSSADLARFLDKMPDEKRQVADLTAETFGEAVAS